MIFITASNHGWKIDDVYGTSINYTSSKRFLRVDEPNEIQTKFPIRDYGAARNPRAIILIGVISYLIREGYDVA